jgi:Cu/Ag efflux protein CusF
MKTPLGRSQILLALLTVTLALALPVQAARWRRLPGFQTETFLVSPKTMIAVGTQRAASLGNLRLGDRVSIGYVQENGVLVARRIADGVPHKVASPGSNPSPKTHHSPVTQALLHAHGVVRAIDVQAGTVTIVHRLR